jgi:hypothetical protein
MTLLSFNLINLIQLNQLNQPNQRLNLIPIKTVSLQKNNTRSLTALIYPDDSSDPLYAFALAHIH